MREFILIILSSLVTSGWWQVGVWGLPQNGFRIPLTLLTFMFTIVLLFTIIQLIIEHWD